CAGRKVCKQKVQTVADRLYVSPVSAEDPEHRAPEARPYCALPRRLTNEAGGGSNGYFYYLKRRAAMSTQAAPPRMIATASIAVAKVPSARERTTVAAPTAAKPGKT